MSYAQIHSFTAAGCEHISLGFHVSLVLSHWLSSVLQSAPIDPSGHTAQMLLGQKEAEVQETYVSVRPQSM